MSIGGSQFLHGQVWGRSSFSSLLCRVSRFPSDLASTLWAFITSFCFVLLQSELAPEHAPSLTESRPTISEKENFPPFTPNSLVPGYGTGHCTGSSTTPPKGLLKIRDCLEELPWLFCQKSGTRRTIYKILALFHRLINQFIFISYLLSFLSIGYEPGQRALAYLGQLKEMKKNSQSSWVVKNNALPGYPWENANHFYHHCHLILKNWSVVSEV